MTSLSLTHVNGSPATADQLAPHVFAGYAHFTAMQVRDHRVRGLDLHLQRLRQASDILFDHHLPDEEIRGHLRAALRDAPADASLTCYLAPRPGPGFAPLGRPEIDVVVRVTDAATPPAGPLALDVVRHQRFLAAVKQTGEAAKAFYVRGAVARGFDDAAFADDAGRLSEATIWNLAFWDGETVLWPRADVLAGVTMQVLARRLEAQGVPQRTREIRQDDLTADMQAVVMNSWSPAVAVARIGEHVLAPADTLVPLLHAAYADEPAVTV